MAANKPQQFHRLSTEQYEMLERKIASQPIVQATTTDVQAGFMLGVQYVLKALREGWVVGA